MQSARRTTVLSCAVAATAVTVLLSAGSARATLSFDGTSTVTQDFNTLPTGSSQTWTDDTTTSGTVGSAPGWFIQHNLLIAADGYRRFSGRSTGGSGTGSFYNYATTTTAGDTDRAIGSVASATTSTLWYALRLQNTSNQTINSFTLTYDGEQYRDGGNATGAAQTMTVGYKINAGSIQDTNFTAVSALTFTTPTHGTAATALNGNDPLNRVAGITATISGLTWEPGQDLWIRWVDTDSTGNDHAMAIDNVTFSGTLGGAGAASPTYKLDADGTWDAPGVSDGNWLNNNAPTGTGGVVRLGSQISANRTVTLNTSPTVSTLEINTPAKDYTLAANSGFQLNVTSGGSVNINGLALNGGAPANPSGGTLISAPVNFAGDGSFRVNDTLAKLTVTGAVTVGTGAGMTLAGGSISLPAGTTWTGTTTLDNKYALSISAPGQLGTGTATANKLVLANGANLTVTADMALADVTAGNVEGVITSDNNVTLGNVDGAGILSKKRAGTVTVNNIRNGGVYIAAADRTGSTSAGILKIAPSGGADSGTSVIKFLRFESTSSGGAILGQFDITDNKLIIDYDLAKGNNPLGQAGTAGLQSYASSVSGSLVHTRVAVALWNAYNTASTTTHWDKLGLTSSLAQNDPQGIHSVGYVEASRLLNISGSETATWGGQTVDATSILVAYCIAGDTNFDGKIDADDYARVDRQFAKDVGAVRSGSAADQQGVYSQWVDGDFNYDAIVNSADLLIIDKSFLVTHPSSPAAADLLAQREAQFGDAYVSSLLAGVPEPTSLSLLAVAATPLLARRRRQG